MKLQNKKTGEIVPASNIAVGIGNDGKWYDSLAELNKDWKDYEEPKGYWSYDTFNNDVTFNSIANEDDRKADQAIGNYFETEEEAEKAVEKLKAWKRLKDKGFRITLNDYKGNAWLQANWGNLQGDYSDVLLLFGGEE